MADKMRPHLAFNGDKELRVNRECGQGRLGNGFGENLCHICRGAWEEKACHIGSKWVRSP